MSLAIDVNHVTQVLLADGWHRCDGIEHGYKDGDPWRVSSFGLDAYEYIESRPNREYHESHFMLSGGAEELLPATGFSFLDADTHAFVSGPLTSVIAVITDREHEW